MHIYIYIYVTLFLSFIKHIIIFHFLPFTTEPKERNIRSFLPRFFLIRNFNKKLNLIKKFVSSFFTYWHQFCSIEIDGDVILFFLKFDQLKF
ncbi:hypothetical protein AHAS_Ahas13G0170800 [Arachis hypogaea]